MNFAMDTLGLKETGKFFQTSGSHSKVHLENAKKNLVFYFGGGRHASFPQKPVVNIIVCFMIKS